MLLCWREQERVHHVRLWAVVKALDERRVARLDVLECEVYARLVLRACREFENGDQDCSNVMAIIGSSATA